MQGSKNSPVLTASRGARLIDLVKQNKLNISPQLSIKTQRRFSTNEPFFKDAPKPRLTIPNEENDYLKFSSQLKFDPNASPSSSILSKRKGDADTADQSPFGSSSKRKRVGFRDPVSSTKEYLITPEEERQKSTSLIRCLVYDNDAEADEDDELISDKENVHKPEVEEDPPEVAPAAEVKFEVPESLSDHNYGSPQNTDVTTSSEESIEPSVESDGKLVFKDKQELMEYITKNLSIDELFEKLTHAEEESIKRKELITKVVKTLGFTGLLKEYFTLAESKSLKLTTEQNAIITSILSEISALMEGNNSIKHKVLDILSSKHSSALLDHAIQESSTSSVCDQISTQQIVNYLIHKVNIAETDENDAIIASMNRSMVHNLISSTHKGKEIVPGKLETQELMRLLFKNKPKMEIFDTVHEFLRKLLQNH